ncbi:hypothetical protein BaRGS_00016165 [Batillaria attramentaria]|uniref:Uncharacterized protein n=1 Tax=Batillaria attramentaria TaxID=370345 RepID=A0ABD0KZB2_9CAEN
MKVSYARSLTLILLSERIRSIFFARRHFTESELSSPELASGIRTNQNKPTSTEHQEKERKNKSLVSTMSEKEKTEVTPGQQMSIPVRRHLAETVNIGPVREIHFSCLGLKSRAVTVSLHRVNVTVVPSAGERREKKANDVSKTEPSPERSSEPWAVAGQATSTESPTD